MLIYIYLSPNQFDKTHLPEWDIPESPRKCYVQAVIPRLMDVVIPRGEKGELHKSNHMRYGPTVSSARLQYPSLNDGWADFN